MLKSRGGTPVFTCDGDDRRILLSLKFSIRRDFEGWENWARIFFGVACRFNEGFFLVFMVALAYPGRVVLRIM